MKNLFIFIGIAAALLFVGAYVESQKEPYEEGMHFDYSIKCENGFVYKVLGNGRGTIQVLNSDGTPLKCGRKIY